MNTRPLYPHGRASAPVGNPIGQKLSLPPHDLIERLRAVREQGDGAMTAVEKYDPDFSIKLSMCATEAEADHLLDEWLARRLDVLQRTQSHLRKVWQSAHMKQQNEREAS